MNVLQHMNQVCGLSLLLGRTRCAIRCFTQTSSECLRPNILNIAPRIACRHLRVARTRTAIDRNPRRLTLRSPCSPAPSNSIGRHGALQLPAFQCPMRACLSELGRRSWLPIYGQESRSVATWYCGSSERLTSTKSPARSSSPRHSVLR